MDRAYVQRLLANAKKRATTVLHLPVCGQDLELYTTLNWDQQVRLIKSGGFEDDADVRVMINTLRFVLVHEGELLLKSYAEASGFVNALDPKDMRVLFDRLSELGEQARSARQEEQAEAGK